MRIRPAIVYNTLAICFAFFGALTMLKVGQVWHVLHVFPLISFLYAVANFAVAYCFYKRQRWLFHIFLLNAIGQAGLLFYRHTQGLSPVAPLVILPARALLLWYLYSNRKRLGDSIEGRIAGGIFVVAWGATMVCMALIV